MNQFVQRVVNYLANEVLIKGLASSRTFQRLVVKTDQSLKEFQRQSNETLNSAINDFAKRQASTEATNFAAKGPPKRPLTGFPGFVSAFFREIRKDLGLGG